MCLWVCLPHVLKVALPRARALARCLGSGFNPTQAGRNSSQTSEREGSLQMSGLIRSSLTRPRPPGDTWGHRVGHIHRAGLPSMPTWTRCVLLKMLLDEGFIPQLTGGPPQMMRRGSVMKTVLGPTRGTVTREKSGWGRRT